MLLSRVFFSPSLGLRMLPQRSSCGGNSLPQRSFCGFNFKPQRSSYACLILAPTSRSFRLADARGKFLRVPYLWAVLYVIMPKSKMTNDSYCFFFFVFFLIGRKHTVLESEAIHMSPPCPLCASPKAHSIVKHPNFGFKFGSKTSKYRIHEL